MTTIIIIVVVALVFFVTICVVTFMVWKREAEMRTDSIKAIENSLGEMLDGLAGDQAVSVKHQLEKKDTPYDHVLQEMQHMQREIGDKIRKESDSKAIRQKERDPFSWVRAEQAEKKHQAADDVPAAAEIGENVATTANAAKEAISSDTANILEAYTVPAPVQTGDAVNAELHTDAETADQTELDEGVSIFKPRETRSRGLKWVEVFVENPPKLFRRKQQDDAEEPLEESLEKPEDADASAERMDSPDEAPRPEESSPQAHGEIQLDEAEALLQEAEAFLEKNSQSKQEAQDDSQEIEELAETEDAWDLDEEEPALWDFDELAGQDQETLGQAEYADTYQSIEIDASFELETAAFEDERQEAVAAEDAEEASGDKPALPENKKTEPDSELDELLSELMRMPVVPEEDFETGKEPESARAGRTGDAGDAYQLADPPKPQTGYNVGRSGKEYTVSELEMLIKE